MANAEQEIEVKLMVRSLDALQGRLLALGAKLESARVHETNLRFDRSSGELSRERKALRLRKDSVSRLTFKGPQQPGETASIRQEIEFEVSDFQAARHFLEALGYSVSVMYEKYRATYRLGEVLVTLDEMPYGSFVEIEGSATGESATKDAAAEESATKEAGSKAGMVETLKATAAALGLNWEARSSESYLALFEHLRQTRRLTAHDLTFLDLQGVEVQPADLGLRFAD